MDVATTLVYAGNMRCEATGADGKVMPIDPAARAGQAGSGPSPLDLLALAHGACTAMMMAKTAAAAGLNVDGMKVEVLQDYAPGPPMKLVSVRIRFAVPRTFTAEEVGKLRAGAELCPVHTSLRSDIRVTLEVVQPA